ncbi:MAG: hypothetical protein JWL61_2305 [Gemmatimonadetes bacterium]|nr:hypothetical protein [Gemmatimonadota bacterium]
MFDSSFGDRSVRAIAQGEQMSALRELGPSAIDGAALRALPQNQAEFQFAQWRYAPLRRPERKRTRRRGVSTAATTSPALSEFKNVGEPVPWLHAVLAEIVMVLEDAPDDVAEHELRLHAATNAQLLLRYLHPSTLRPDIAADQDGRIGIDWIVDRKNMVTVSVDHIRTIFFASTMSGRRLSGSEHLQDVVPAPLNYLLNQLSALAASR